MSESKDQAATQSKDKPTSFDEAFEKGWDQVELMTSQEASAKEKAKPRIGFQQ